MFLLFLLPSLSGMLKHCDLHSNMFLLFPKRLASRYRQFNRFTFQYVSIISLRKHLNLTLEELFTFQYVSIISIETLKDCGTCQDLHSNMFLLFLLPAIRKTGHYENLHSNMFLLFLKAPLKTTSYISIYIPICFYYF